MVQQKAMKQGRNVHSISSCFALECFVTRCLVWSTLKGLFKCIFDVVRSKVFVHFSTNFPVNFFKLFLLNFLVKNILTS